MTRAIHRPSSARGTAHHGWLDARHTFSFADYYDRDHQGFRALRVLNEDRIAPGRGFGMHPHRDMEIVTYVVAGTLAHRDSLGNAGEIGPGQVQAMSAGTGVTHSEVNPDPDAPVHLLQIWIHPDRAGHAPRYAEWRPAGIAGPLTLVASPDGADGSCAIHADARMYVGHLASGTALAHPASSARGYWVQLIAGAMRVNGVPLAIGDGLALEHTDTTDFVAGVDAHFLLFDLA